MSQSWLNMKRSLLFLVHRIPFPPDKGDKIRSFNLLRHLSGQFQIHLGCFVDDPNDMSHQEALNKYCVDICCVPLNPRLARLKSLVGLVTGEALSCPYYYSSVLRDWIDTIMRSQPVEQILVYSSQMAQYVLDERFSDAMRVIDFVDMDSDKWRQYAPTHTWPMSALYRREADRLLDFERRVASVFDRSMFVSRKEMEHFASVAGINGDRLSYANNGVDTNFFDPMVDCASPFPAASRPIVFVGAMDYWPNADAVKWFAEQALPAIRSQQSSVRFYIVGSKPGAGVRKLAAEPDVEVTGRVEDVRPYLRFADVVVAPLQIARGIQNKVLESMAMARPTVVTPAALDGINAIEGDEVVCRDSPAAFADAVLELLGDPGRASELGAKARERVCTDYGWEDNLNRFSAILGV